MRFMRRLLPLLSLLFVCPLLAQKPRAVTVSPTTIRIGSLVSTTGDWSTLGYASVVALDLAAAGINAEMVAMRLPYRVETYSEDTALVPAKALERITSMATENISYVI